MNGGATLTFHEYTISSDSASIVRRGDNETDGVDELFATDFSLFCDGFESGNLAAWLEFKAGSFEGSIVSEGYWAGFGRANTKPVWCSTTGNQYNNCGAGFQPAYVN